MRKSGLGALIAALAGIGAAAYYFTFMKKPKPQVELYFDDGSMLSYQASSAEGTPFTSVAKDILSLSPLAD